ncbi:AAA family ATPase [Dongia sp.]|uniref:AAA family ATPase n=1 Tax=Dongia sp. TaxID=1977262 RepID=UPI0035B4AF0E
MIRVEKIQIQEFRGIRDLTLDLKASNFAVCGPNGTGKSGVVDAIEFALTGSISRLAGRGTGGISIKDHGPHVDSRNRPDKAKVILTASIPSLKKAATIERSVKDPSTPTITPNDADVLKALRELEHHPEFVLSRRELIRYILSTPGDRAKEVQTLLRLDQVEDVRTSLQKISNASGKEVNPLKREKTLASDQLLGALDIPQISGEKLLGAANAWRAILDLPPLTELTSATSLKDGMTTAAAELSRQVPKAQAIADLKKLQDAFTKLESTETNDQIKIILEQLNALNADPAISSGVTREQLLTTAIELFDGKVCPVCDTVWTPDEFRRIVDAKLTHLEEISKKRAAVEELLEPIIGRLEEITEALKVAASYGKSLKPPIDTKILGAYFTQVRDWAKRLADFLPISSSISTIGAFTVVPAEVRSLISDIDAAIKVLPEPTQQDAAREYLTISQERLEAYRSVSLRLKQAEERAELSRRIFDAYAKVSTTVLDGIYKEVERDFSDLYRFINEEDEGDFRAQLTPSIGKLGFDVDFYGRGYFPPGAYHSEGHQDSMGLCLYLALMKHLLGAGFTFAVLDDVLMSVDSGHRREVCRLLKEKFPETQFIFTTHDHIWLRHMKTAGLITSSSAAHFRKWTVDQGPTEWDQLDLWQEIDNDLAKNDVRAAAALLRHYLEYISAEACHRLRAQVEFRGDAQFELGALMPGAISGMRRALKAGKEAAQSWGKTDIHTNVDEREKAFSDLAGKSNVEQWQINPAVHYNEWAALGPNDFRPVVAAFKELITAFSCPDCHGLYYVTPERGSREGLRCTCGSTSISLVTKPAEKKKAS